MNKRFPSPWIRWWALLQRGALLGLLLFFGTGCVTYYSPAPVYYHHRVWVPGHWRYRPRWGDWVWVPGHWEWR